MPNCECGNSRLAHPLPGICYMYRQAEREYNSGIDVLYVVAPPYLDLELWKSSFDSVADSRGPTPSICVVYATYADAEEFGEFGDKLEKLVQSYPDSRFLRLEKSPIETNINLFNIGVVHLCEHSLVQQAYAGVRFESTYFSKADDLIKRHGYHMYIPFGFLCPGELAHDLSYRQLIDREGQIKEDIWGISLPLFQRDTFMTLSGYHETVLELAERMMYTGHSIGVYAYHPNAPRFACQLEPPESHRVELPRRVVAPKPIATDWAQIHEKYRFNLRPSHKSTTELESSNQVMALFERLDLPDIEFYRYGITKFTHQAQAYFKSYYINRNHEIIRPSDLPGGTFCLFFSKDPIEIDHMFLVEACRSKSGLTMVTGIVRYGCEIHIPEAEQYEVGYPYNQDGNPISLHFICNDHPMYRNFLSNIVAYYSHKLNPAPEICVAYFGDDIPEVVKHKCTVNQYPASDFSMSKARNAAIDLGSATHGFMLDLDCYLSAENIQSIIDTYNSVRHNGVINLRWAENLNQGNSLCFGDLNVLRKNRYHEGFKKFWFEDTEHYMNFARIGVVPLVEILDFVMLDHPRDITKEHWKTNVALFEQIMKFGRESDK